MSNNVIDKLEKKLQAKCECYGVCKEMHCNNCREAAREIYAEFDQEKKDQAKKIFNRIFDDDTAGDLGEFCGYGWIYDIDEAKAIAKEYGVEL